MTTLPAALRDKVEFAPADLDWLHQLVGDWQLVADMSMADLVLWVRNKNGRLMAMDQCRPSNNTTVHPDDRDRPAYGRQRVKHWPWKRWTSCQVRVR